ncbi:SsgA family sporulation/cell division regulator [Actinacidiphila paucisporea]|uniref:SsgA family sporulation/cell division regulator n=1 Tax=Actinacidiphila paucisporea TaxID=310782 RepID=UPI001160EB32|nr:SsgA family sporulation/cell division regulator [Actinacidiphila paucisporea]
MRTATTGYLMLSEEHLVPVAAELVYRPRDPLAVSMVLCGPDGVEAAWTFAWQILAQGLVAPAGEGDLRVRPVPARGTTPAVELRMTSSFTARVLLPAREIGYFVGKIRGRAHVDASHIRRSLDAELSAIREAI